jgi:thioredoxin reductase
MHDLIVLGGGPAGLTAMIYALRRRLDALLVSPDLGGKTNAHLQLPDLSRHLVIHGEELVSRFVEEIEMVETACALEAARSVETLGAPEAPEGYRVRTTGGRSHEARALIVATGARPRRLEVPGEAEFAQRGVIYSAVSYAPLFAGRTTLVAGDGQLALRSTVELARYARHVTLAAPGGVDAATPFGRKVTALPNVTILAGYAVQRITGDLYARGAVLARGSDRREVAVDAVFVEQGLLPNSGLVATLVDCDATGRIAIDARNATSAPGIFAAGDVTDVYAEQVLIAVGEGAKAALSAYHYLLAHPETALAVDLEEWR